MHHIKKLELVGFKSFCDRTQIQFKEGITSIVGPNGCGKSNIADAISWVVGEQSAKCLRSDRMEGVIFNGTQARKAVGFAEVVLTLSLTNQIDLPEKLKMNPEAFTVGRRLYRSGDSEYYLDGRRCRLKDIQALFEGTGLGPNSYALLEQGRIGQILSSKPAERRSLIEEAARITLFKSRRYSAEMKLELAQQNLIRAQDIIREVVRQLNSLRRQAAKARRYKRLREELRLVQRLKIGMEERQLRSRLDECSSRFINACEHEQTILSELEVDENSRASALRAYASKEEIVTGARESLAGLKLDDANARSLLDNQETQKLGLLARSNEIEKEQEVIGERALVVQHEQERLSNLACALEGDIERQKRTLEAEEARSAALQDAISQTEGNIEDLRSFLLSGAGSLSDLRNLQARCQESLSRISARADRLEEQRRRDTHERIGLLAEVEHARSASEQKTLRQTEVVSIHKDLEAKTERLDVCVEQVSADLTALVDDYGLLQQRFSLLEEVERRRSNYSEGVQKFLSSAVPGGGASQAKTLADCVETDPAYEAAVEDYLNEPLQYIMVEGLQDAVDSVERLKRIGAGKCTFMTLHNGHKHKPAPGRAQLSGEGVLGYLDDLLRMSEDVRRAFERALPEYASTVIVSDLNTAFRVAESFSYANFLTVAGESYSPRGTLSAVGERKSAAGLLAVKRERRELESKLNRLSGKIQETREKLARLKQEQAAVAESLKSVSAESRKLELDVALTGHEIARLEGELARMDQMENVASAELFELVREKNELEAKLNEAATSILEIEEHRRNGSEELSELGSRLQSLKSEASDLARHLGNLVSTQAVSQERRSRIESDLRRLSREAEDVRKRAEANRSEKTSTLERIAELVSAQQESETRIGDCRRLIKEAEAALEERHLELVAQRTALETLDGQLRQLHKVREEAMSVRANIEIEKTRLENDLGHLERGCQEEFHTSLNQITAEIEDSDCDRDYQEVAQSHDRLRETIENFGAINMRALEEYQELDQRFQFLDGQRLDIEKSIADTQKAISEINRRSVEQFEETYKSIRENFREVFQILFGGGQCDLRLLDESDVLESGIDIVAQPPGKRLQNVLLLSGGEKALTALALLIAIFRYRPSPFCVLDEVDAALDDANIERFTRLIAELSRDTQFLMITHNKRSMGMSNTLYGVTMEEPGISKIVGVDFNRR